ncbi:MAG: cupredoxin family copper-binding protein [Candidatus Pacebacteria bacterium]|nr:cupredoxin family copper-binding protein [Candidatus Paceibacterota bacterium]
MKPYVTAIIVAIIIIVLVIIGIYAARAPMSALYPSSGGTQQNNPPPSSGGTQNNPPPSSGGGTPQQSTASVTISNFAFSPATLTVSVGTTVIWTNNDPAAHQIQSNSGLFGSNLLGTGNAYSHAFTQAGTYPYHCAIHTYMTGTIIVQ